MAQIIDTHSHLHGKEFHADIQEVVQRAEDAGAAQMALVGVDPDDTERAIALAARFPGRFFVVAGLHPHESSKWNAATRQRIEEQVRANASVIKAVGEMGLDYHYDFAPREIQREAFIGQMEIAREAGLPIVIHCREAYDECMAMLRDFYGGGDSALSDGGPRGVLHCYFGSLEQAHEAVELGFMLGIGGSCTFKNAAEVHRVVTEIPLENLVLETDAPYMAPIPYRGKRNEPAYLVQVAERIGHLKQTAREDVIRATETNARRLYRLER